MSGMAQVIDLPLDVLRDRLVNGAARAGEVTEAVLKRIGSLPEGDRAALAWIDEDYARRIAKSRDSFRGQARALGSLHGVPVLVDDAFDIGRVPMKRGFDPLGGALSEFDSAVVAGLRAAGAQLFAKSAIPALRIGDGDIGGPSLLASRCFPLALCVDARGETLADASRKGVFGYRLSTGMIPRSGLLDLSPSLDGVTLLANDLGDLAELGDIVSVFDASDRRSEPGPRLQLAAAYRTKPPMRPMIGFFKDAREAARSASDELVANLAERAFEAELPEVFAEVAPQSERVVRAEGAKCLKPFERRFQQDMPDAMKGWIAAGEEVSAVDYLRALDWIPVLRAGMAEIFARCNAAAFIGPIEAEDGASVEVETLAAFLGLPAVTLPVLETPDGSPLGLILLGKRGEDARLLSTAHWLLKTLNGEDL